MKTASEANKALDAAQGAYLRETALLAAAEREVTAQEAAMTIVDAGQIEAVSDKHGAALGRARAHQLRVRSALAALEGARAQAAECSAASLCAEYRASLKAAEQRAAKLTVLAEQFNRQLGNEMRDLHQLLGEVGALWTQIPADARTALPSPFIGGDWRGSPDRALRAGVDALGRLELAKAWSYDA